MTPELIARIQSLISLRPKYDFLTALMWRTVHTPEDWIVTDGTQGMSAQAVLTAVIRYANHFANQGLGQGQVVGIECNDRLLQVMLHSALLALGAVRKTLNVEELIDEQILKHCDFVICGWQSQTTFPENRCLRHGAELDENLGSQLIDEHSLDCFISSFAENDPISIGNTSSTTGTKKYFLNSRNLLEKCTKFIEGRYFSNGEINFLAFYEDSHGSTHMASTCALRSGGSIVFCTLENWFEISTLFSKSTAKIFPRDLLKIIGQIKRLQGSTHHKIISLRVLGGPLPISARKYLETHIADQVVNSYSSNEAGHIAEMDSEGIGTLYDGVEVLVLDENFQALPFGSAGLIAVKTPTLIDSYLWNDDLNVTSFKDGWFYTNDYGLLKDSVTLQLLGRSDDMLNLGGIKVSPIPFEDLIRKISTIRDCVIFSRQLAMGGARFLVCVETEISTPESNKAALTAQIHNIVPKGFGEFDLVFFDAFPVTETRKVRRKTLMSMAIEKLALGNRTEAIRRAKSLHQSGNLAAAEAIYIALLNSEPQDFDGLHLLGLIQIQKGQFETGVRLIAAALKIKPDSALAYYNLGNGLYQLKRIDDALASYDMALSIQPIWPEAHCNRGNTLLELDRAADAVASFDHALLLKPDYAEALYNRGNALLEMQNFEAALSSFDAALAINPNDAESWSNRGNALHKLHRLEEALQSYQLALTLKSDYAEVFNNIGHVYKDLKNLDASVESYESALSIKPDYEYLFGTYVHTKTRVCNWLDWQHEVMVFESKVLAGQKSTTPSSVLSLTANPVVQKAAAEIYYAARHPLASIAYEKSPTFKKERLHIGYVSADFREHAVSYLMAGVFEAHDRERFEVYGYDIGPAPDSPTRSRVIAAFDQFKIVSDLSDKGIAEQIRQDQIDILIDLTGYTKGARTGIFAYKPATIQINYLGFPGTMGAPFMDYIIADRVLIPEESRQYFTEQVLYLPHCFQANDDKRVIAPPKPKSHFGLPEDAFVFGCFNQSAKFTPTLFEVWLSILRQVPNSVLWLIEDNPTQVKNLRTYSQERGIDPNRLIFTGKLPYPEHLARYAHIDLVLDTLPFNGGTTTSDALWGGAPVLTCIGQTFAGRMSASLLTAIGLPELITHSLEDYERLAIDLATHPEELKALRQRLGKNRTESSVFDTAAFTRAFEKVLLSKTNGV